jgi:hypothetical protein
VARSFAYGSFLRGPTPIFLQVLETHGFFYRICKTHIASTKMIDDIIYDNEKNVDWKAWAHTPPFRVRVFIIL